MMLSLIDFGLKVLVWAGSMMQALINVQSYMINNYFEYEYKPSHKIFTHEQTGCSIYLGDISAALDIAFLKGEQIFTVTAAVAMDHVAYDSSVNHIIYPLLDMKSQNITKYFGQFFDLMEKELSRTNVLVHCAAGISRSSTLVIAYIMRKKCFSFREAIGFVREKRPSICPNLGFERQLKEYEGFLNKQAESGFERRFGSKTSQERKHINTPKILPEISSMGRTQLRPKILDIFSLEVESRFSQQRSRKETNDNIPKELQFYGTKRVTFKPKKSKSMQEKQQQKPQHANNIYPFIGDNMSNIEYLKKSVPIQRMEEAVSYKLNLNNTKKATTERQIMVKQLHKLAYY